MDEFINATKYATLDRKEEIIFESQSLGECMVLLETYIQEFTSDYVKNSKFFKSVPVKKLNKLTKKLKPLFKQLYVTFKYSFFKKEGSLFFCSIDFTNWPNL